MDRNSRRGEGPGPEHRQHHQCAARLQGENGGALMEVALLMPLLTSFLLGIVTSGIMFNAKLQLSAAVREGARYGAAMPVDQKFVSGTWASNVRSVAYNRGAGEVQLANVCVALVSGSSPVPISSAHTTRSDGKACYDDSAAGDSGRRVQVLMTRSGRIDTGFFSIPVTTSVQGTASHEDQT